MRTIEKNSLRAECYRVYLTTHRGRVRAKNEDNFSVNSLCKKTEYQNISFEREFEAPVVAAVFDGMGGEAMGEYASFLSAKAAKPLYSAVKANPEKSVEELAAQFVRRANGSIRDLLEENKCKTGGSTVAAVIIKNEIAYPFSLGDSRLYLWRSDLLTCISEDHTLAMKKLKANIYTREEAEKSPDSHKLTDFLGADIYRQGIAPQHYEPMVLRKSDKLLLCSDGIYGELNAKEMRSIIKNNPDNPTLELVRAAVNKGGRDNATAMLIERVI